MKCVSVEFRLLFFFCYIVLNLSLARSRRPANIILVVADDLGFHDVGFHGSEISTPNLDKLAEGGVILENYYVSPSCTPSRSQLLTGRYGIHTGQTRNIQPLQPSCLRLDEVTIAEKLKARKYRTHMVGKWHLGHCRTECTPNERGFDSFYGILLGSGDHYRHYKRERAKSLHYGYDFWRNDTVSETEGLARIYSTTSYRNEALRIVSSHDPKYPLFMYLAFQAPHSPIQVPYEWVNRNRRITDPKRRYIAGMVSALDSAVGDLVTSLKSRGLWENTVLVFTTDNGGQILHGASNWPLRGGKGSFWEGGVRGVGFVNSPLIKRPGRKNYQLMHISDWFPTFIHLSRGDLSGTKPLDGVNQWKTISKNKPSPRREILLGMLSGTAKQTVDPIRVHEECQKYIPETHIACRKKKPFKPSLRKCSTKKIVKCFKYKGAKWCHRAALRRGKWKLLVGVQKPGNWVPPRGSGNNVTCSTEYENRRRLQLYDVKNDPNETTDLSLKYPKKVAKLMAKLESYRKTSVPEWTSPMDIRGSPRYNGGVWGPWLSSNYTFA